MIALTLSGSLAYATSYDGGMRIIDVNRPTDPVVAPFRIPEARGVVDLTLSDGILGLATLNGWSLYGVGDPLNPQLFATIRSLYFPMRVVADRTTLYGLDGKGFAAFNIENPAHNHPVTEG